MVNQDHIENEIKLRVSDLAAARARIERMGYAVSRARVFESNAVFDTAEAEFRERGELVRMRRVRPAESSDGEAAAEALLTFKGTALGGKHKRRPELETSVADGSVVEAIFERLGLRQTFRYEKYRTEFHRDGTDGVITLDETPIGFFLELEGPGEWVDQTAHELGFSQGDYVLASYGALYFEYCREQGLEPVGMVFPG